MVGTTSGIGKETARAFAKKGAHVIMAVRNTKLGEAQVFGRNTKCNCRCHAVGLVLLSIYSQICGRFQCTKSTSKHTHVCIYKC